MKNWQKTRNYRRMKDENGNVIANVITVFGEKIEVSDELFTVYAHMFFLRFIVVDNGKHLLFSNHPQSNIRTAESTPKYRYRAERTRGKQLQ